MDENEFIFNGKTYIAVPEPDDCCCECDLLQKCSPDGINGVPKCQANKRTDGRDVIFVEKQI